MEKTIKILLITLVLMTGCKVTKKATESTVAKTSEQTEFTHQVKIQDVVNVQNDVNSELETVTVKTETEYYEPGSVEQGAGSIEQGAGSAPLANTGAIKKQTTTTTTTKKKDQDKSKIAAASEKKEDTSSKKEGETETKSRKSEVVKKGIAQWKVIVSCIVLIGVGVIYVLIRKKIIGIPFLTRLLKWLKLLS